MSTLLIVEDHQDFRQEVRKFLESGHLNAQMLEAGSGEEGIVVAKQRRPDLIIMDYWLGGINGMDAAEQIKKVLPQCPIIMVSMFDVKEISHLNSRHAIKTFIAKDHLFDELIPSIKKHLASVN